MIPGNDDSMSSIELFVSEVSKVIKNNKVKTSPAKNENISSTQKKSTRKKQVIDVKADKDLIETKSDKTEK